MTGIFLTAVGVIVTLNQGFLLSKFWLKKFKERDLEIFMMAVFALGFFFMNTSLLGIFIAGLIFVTFGQSILRVVLTSQVVGNALERKGEVLGAMASVMSLSMIVGPIIGGALFVSHISWPYIICGLLSLVSLIILYYTRKGLSKFETEVEVPNDQTII